MCIFPKDKAGAGSLYRNQYEMILVLKNGRGGASRHIINRRKKAGPRSNLWRYPEPRSSRRDGGDRCKPVQLVGDALLDSTDAGDIVLDAFLDSGTTLIAAERTKRVCRGLANNPRSVDTAIRRWQAFTGQAAHHAVNGRSFSDLCSTLENDQP